MVKRRFLVVAAIALTAGAAHAQLNAPTKRAQLWDFGVQTRYIGEQAFDGQAGSGITTETDLGWGFGFTYNVNERFNFGFSIYWRSANYTATVVPALDPTNTEAYSSWLDASTIAFAGDWYVLPKRVTPYVSAALGWSFLDTNTPAYDGCRYDPWFGYTCSTDEATFGTQDFVYTVGVGMRLELSEAFFVRVGYDYNGLDREGAEGLDIFRLDAGITIR